MSRIEPHEELTAKTLIAEQLEELGIPNPPTPTGWFVLVKTYIRDDRTAGGIVIPDMVRQSDQYQSIAALVIAMGPEAYTGPRFQKTGAWCKPGDWVIVPRYEGFPFVFRSIPMQMLPDDKVIAVIGDPTDVAATYWVPKV